MKKKLFILCCILTLIVNNLVGIVQIQAATNENEAKIVSDDGDILYITEDTKASTGTTWGNTGFVLRLDKVDSRNPLKDDKYAIIRFTDEGVGRDVIDIPGGKKQSTYTIKKFAIYNALEKSPYNKTHTKSLVKEFDEMVLKDEPIYLNGIFQVYHGGNKYGPEIFTYDGGYDSKGNYLKGIYRAEEWRDPSTFGQYFNIKVPYHPGVEPVSVEYRTQYNELLYSKAMESQKVTSEVKPSVFPKTYKKNGYTYTLDRSYYINLNKPSTKVDNYTIGKNNKTFKDVSERDANVQSGGLKFVAIYKIEPDELEEVPADEKEVEFEEPEPTGVIKADERGNEQFNVEDGIPSSENLYVNVFTTDYLISYRFVKKVGIKKVPVKVEKKYTLTWETKTTEKDPITGEDKDTYVEHSSTETKKETVELKRAYGYWVIDQLDVFSLSSAEVKNGALPGDSITINAEGVKLPNVLYQVDKELDKHVFLPLNLQDKYVLPAAEIIGTTSKPLVPEEDLSIYVDSKVGELIVKNDKLVYNSRIVMDDKEVEKEGDTPSDLQKGRQIEPNVLYKHGLSIPLTEANDIYETEGTVKYTSAIHIGKSNEVKEIVYEIGEINPVIVHTPTVCDAKITDLKAYNQKVTPDTSRASLILDKTFKIQLPTYGEHNDYLGYGSRDYAKYIETREVKFPFDVYSGTRYIAAGTWIPINSDETSYYLPTWVPEGQYTIEFRAPAINSSANSENSEMYANYSISNYIAVDTIDVDVSGRIYDLTMYDITDYPTWQDVFRNKDSLTLTGTNYTVGINDQNGLTTGRLAKYTFPLVNGSHPTYETVGAVKLGYCTRFKFTTIGDLYKGDHVKIEPKFYYVDAKGQNRQEVDIYYTETFEGKRNYMVKVGGDKDKLNTKSYMLGDKYWQVPDLEIESTSYVTGKTSNDIRAQKDTLFTFGGLNISNAFRTFCGTSSFTPSKTIPSTVDPKTVIQSVQNWYGEYYLPSDVHVLPKAFDLNTYIKENGAIDYTEDIWLKKGYIIVNFNIVTYQEKKEKGHLSYINKENALKGYCNMWKLEGSQLAKTDAYGNTFEFKYGDYVMYDIEKSAAKDYKSGGTH
nr:DUF5704 domain-containing protein [uncultured Anaerosporobacter sp.]